MEVIWGKAICNKVSLEKKGKTSPKTETPNPYQKKAKQKNPNIFI